MGFVNQLYEPGHLPTKTGWDLMILTDYKPFLVSNCVEQIYSMLKLKTHPFTIWRHQTPFQSRCTDTKHPPIHSLLTPDTFPFKGMPTRESPLLIVYRWQTPTCFQYSNNRHCTDSHYAYTRHSAMNSILTPETQPFTVFWHQTPTVHSTVNNGHFSHSKYTNTSNIPIHSILIPDTQPIHSMLTPDTPSIRSILTPDLTH